MILFFLAAHGAPDPFGSRELYYLLYDSKVSDLKNTAFRMTELKQIIDTNLKSKRAIFLLDTCNSAGIGGNQPVSTKQESPKNTSKDKANDSSKTRSLVREPAVVATNIDQATAKLFGTSGRAVFTSANVGESAIEDVTWGGGHGVFTWSLLEGLRGKADTNGDKIVTTDELFAYVSKQVQKETDGKQNPQLFSSLGSALELAVLK